MEIMPLIKKNINIKYGVYFWLLLLLNAFVQTDSSMLGPLALLYVIPLISIKTLLTWKIFTFFIITWTNIICYFLTQKANALYKLFPFIGILFSWIFVFLIISKDRESTLLSSLPFLGLSIIFYIKFIREVLKK